MNLLNSIKNAVRKLVTPAKPAAPRQLPKEHEDIAIAVRVAIGYWAKEATFHIAGHEYTSVYGVEQAIGEWERGNTYGYRKLHNAARLVSSPYRTRSDLRKNGKPTPLVRIEDAPAMIVTGFPRKGKQYLALLQKKAEESRPYLREAS